MVIGWKENNGTKDVTDVSVVPRCPVMIKVVISAAGVCASGSCSAVGFCFLVSKCRKSYVTFHNQCAANQYKSYKAIDMLKNVFVMNISFCICKGK